MKQDKSTHLNYRRAIIDFILAYISITALAFGLYLAIVAISGEHIASTFNIRADPSYILAEKLYPILNLFVWVAFSALYFRNKQQNKKGFKREAFNLGVFWLMIALPLDLLSFVLIKNPLSLSAHDFYIGQFPWIYLTYLVVFVSPLCYTRLVKEQ